MRRTIALIAVLAIGLMAVPIAASAKDGGQHKFTAELTGGAEVPPSGSAASGDVKVNIKDGVLKFGLKVENLVSPVAAHIHCAAAGANGAVGVTLPISAPGGVFSGTLGKGHIWAPDDAKGCGWADMADVLAAIRAGNAYVNVHTAGIPSGELRGQLG